MKTIKIFLLLALTFLISGCLKDLRIDEFSDDALSSTLIIKVQMPQGFSYSTQGLVIKLTDPATGLQFSGTTDAAGVANIKVAHGSYIATTEFKHTESGGVIYIFNGTTERLRVTPKDPETISANLPLNVSKTGQIVIKEFYYGGCQNPATGGSYANDKYIILYNNSGDIAYLDSLCIGVVDPYNAPTSGRLSNWVKPGTTELRDSVPNISFAWMFPGTGRDHPLMPGEEVVLATNAINHAASVSTSVNLGKPGYWALYDPILTTGQSVPNAGVNRMIGYWKMGTANQFVISALSPALFVYNMGGKSVEQFVLDTYTRNPGYATNRNFDVLMIDKELIVDGVECFRNVTDTKRLRPEIDNGFAMTDGSGQGQSVHRKVDEAATAAAGGRIVYMDSNNSSNDFEKRATASLLNK
ncbi:MAG: DUF4876 domain-containing protein [Bacteroidales bacterium]|nr:DUF4876 domain-containing protein [Bacteroidales bacterium]